MIELDGFDSGAGRVDSAAWRTYAASIAARLGLSPTDGVFEVGCGSGAFLLALKELGANVAGLDYSSALISMAKMAMPEGEFITAEARELSPLPQYDFVVANGVFHYFPDDSYAQAVLSSALSKARRAVAILEVPDLALREESERMRRDILTPEQYEEKYRGLTHKYYSRKWFADIATHHDFDCQTFDQEIPGYAQNRFRFNCLMTRKSA
ncbi:class I SAM-dependent methyltransferase [Niveibacterium terrae]|uniref:class I SAM-dependent methyltransferase n=1 Tax=Niveibacterium terrae TaxID=3373598 RepID=UPI003A8DC057